MAKKPTSPRKSPLGQYADTPAAPASPTTENAPPPSAGALAPTKHRDTLRRELVDMVARDLLGPSKPDEELPQGEKPGGRYLIGLLAPQNVGVVADELEGVATAGADTPE